MSNQLSIGFAGYPSARFPVIKYWSRKCHTAFPAWVKLFLGGVAQCKQPDGCTLGYWRASIVTGGLAAAGLLPTGCLPITDYYPIPSSLPGHDQVRSEAPPIGSRQFGEELSLCHLNSCNLKGLFLFWERRKKRKKSIKSARGEKKKG